MRIEEIELFRVAMPLKEPWRTAFSEETAIDAVLVRLRMEGVDGWGETAPYRLPQYSPEWADGAFILIRDVLAPALLDVEIESGDALQARLLSFKGNPFAKAGLDNAWWDARAKLEGEPLWRLIGGRGATVPVGADIAVMEDLDDLVAAVGRAQEAGFRRTKLKFRRGWGVNMVARVREAFPDATLHVDCNSGFSLNDLPMFRELDRFDLAMIEQPLGFNDLLDHAQLQRELSTPICLDESIVSVDRARKAIDVDAGRWINIKPGRVGGLTNAIAIHDHCRERGVPCWVGGMLESAVGQGSALALATLPNMQYPADVFPSARLYAEDLSEPEVVLSAPSEVNASELPGHGFRPVPERLARCTIQHALMRRP